MLGSNKCSPVVTVSNSEFFTCICQCTGGLATVAPQVPRSPTGRPHTLRHLHTYTPFLTVTHLLFHLPSSFCLCPQRGSQDQEDQDFPRRVGEGKNQPGKVRIHTGAGGREPESRRSWVPFPSRHCLLPHQSFFPSASCNLRLTAILCGRYWYLHFADEKNWSPGSQVTWLVCYVENARMWAQFCLIIKSVLLVLCGAAS